MIDSSSFDSSIKSISYSTDAVVLDLLKTMPKKNPVGRPPKRKNPAVPIVDSDTVNDVDLLPAAEPITVLDTEANQYITWSDSMKLILKFHCHKYARYRRP